MADRAQDLAAALTEAGFAGWTRAPLAGDASARRYERLSRGGQTRILMDAPGAAEEVGRFLSIADHLRAIGLCAPRIDHADPDRGVVIMEDLGRFQMAQWLGRHPSDETALYAAAVDLLAALQRHPAPAGLARLTPAAGAAMLAPLFDWYAPGCDVALRDDLGAVLRDLLVRHAGRPGVFTLRDCHAENLIWRPDRAGTDRIGVLDFQDALLAPPAYDLASLLRDVRRDVAPETVAAMLARFADAIGLDRDALSAQAAVLGVQRNLRILGIFARLARRDGKDRYRALLPRVRGALDADLAHPALAPLRPFLARALPDPARLPA